MCQLPKLRTEFSKDLARSDGLNIHCKSCYNSYQRERRAARWAEERVFRNQMQNNRRFLAEYGITLDEFTELVIELGSKCERCGKVRRLLPDHDHETGQFRGALCHGCNTGLGLLGDNIEGLEQMITYLKLRGGE